MRPLHIAVFLLPLVILYEIGSFVTLSGAGEGTQRTIKAHRILGEFFQQFGVASLHLPAAALLMALITWHVLSGDRWKVRGWVVGLMGIESLVWTLPLLVLSAMHAKTISAAVSLDWSHLALSSDGSGGGNWSGLSWQARLTIAVGAGLYEELLFRLIGVSFLHFLMKDAGKASEGLASAVAIVGSAIAFALYHQVRLNTGDLDWPRLLFLTAAGLYFGLLYLMRGFGIAVATHAAYDALVLVFLAKPS